MDLAIDKCRQILLDAIASLPVIQRANLPSASGIYFCTEKAELVYVGKAVDLQRRWRAHNFKQHVDAGEWELRCKIVDDSRFCNAEHEEAAYIAMLRPRYNQVVRAKIFPAASDSPQIPGLSASNDKAHLFREPIDLNPDDMLVQRFWNKVQKGSHRQCWRWKGSLRAGYGVIRHNSRLYSAHRVAYILEFGEPSKDLVIGHKCDNRWCCNPSHLEAITNHQNILDGFARGADCVHSERT